MHAAAPFPCRAWKRCRIRRCACPVWKTGRSRPPRLLTPSRRLTSKNVRVAVVRRSFARIARTRGFSWVARPFRSAAGPGPSMNDGPDPSTRRCVAERGVPGLSVSPLPRCRCARVRAAKVRGETSRMTIRSSRQHGMTIRVEHLGEHREEARHSECRDRGQGLRVRLGRRCRRYWRDGAHFYRCRAFHPAEPSTVSKPSAGGPPCQWRERTGPASGPLPADLTASPSTATQRCSKPSC